LNEKLVNNLELYSDLLLSVGTHKGKRPLIPIEVSNLILRLKDEEKIDDKETSKRLGLGKPSKISNIDKRDTTQVKQFLKLQKLSSKSKNLFGWGGTEPDKIPFTTGTIIADLNEKDQDIVIQSCIERGIIKNEAIRILDLKKKSPAMKIEECIEKVLKIRPITEVWYIVSHTINSNFFKTIQKNAETSGKSIVDYCKEIIKSKFNKGKIESVILKGSTIYISMDEECYNFIEQEQHKLKQSFSFYMDTKFIEVLK